MASKWSQATLLRRMEDEFVEWTGQQLIDVDGEVSTAAAQVSVADFAKYISRQIVVEQMTGRKATPGQKPTIKAAKPSDGTQ